MRFKRTILVLMACALVAAAQQPTIYAGGIVNAASFSPMGLPNSNVAQGSIFTIFGTNLGPAKSPALAWPLAKTLGGVSIKINPSSGGSYDAIPIFVGPGQISAIMPSSVGTGPANVVVTYNSQVTSPQQITVIDRSFGAFALNQAGSGPAVLQDYISGDTQPFNMITESAQPGQVVILWGTGLGRVTFDETNPPVPGDMRQAANVEVWVGGKQATVQYAGRSSCCAGVDQINFVVPQGLNGCYVPITVKTGSGVGTVVSNYTSMAVAASRGTCSDQYSYNGVDLSQFTNSGLRQGSISLSRISMNAMGFSINTDTASASFEKLNFSSLISSHGQSGVSQIGACTVFTFKDQPTSADVVPTVGLDAGTPLTLTTPSGSKSLIAQTKGMYSLPPSTGGLPAPFLVPGAYTISGPGGADVGSFSASITVPTLFTPNLDQVQTIPRTNPLTVSWSGGNPQDIVMVLGYSQMTSPSVGAEFICLGKISDGSLTVPPTVLLALPPSSGDNAAIMAGEAAVPVKFNASGLDYGSLTYTMFNMKAPVTYQ